jgi:hypothetical protein
MAEALTNSEAEAAVAQLRKGAARVELYDKKLTAADARTIADELKVTVHDALFYKCAFVQLRSLSLSTRC